MKTWQAILLGMVAYQATISLSEYIERHGHFLRSREYCDQAGKPLLRVGMNRAPWEPPNGDVTIDLAPEVLNVPGGVQGDERFMTMFSNKQFGVCFNEHTLEHLASVNDVVAAVSECVRVADRAVFLCPSPYSLVNLIAPSHYLQVKFQDGEILVRRNMMRTGIIIGFGGDGSGTGVAPLGEQKNMSTKQALVVSSGSTPLVRPWLE